MCLQLLLFRLLLSSLFLSFVSPFKGIVFLYLFIDLFLITNGAQKLYFVSFVVAHVYAVNNWVIVKWAWIMFIFV